MAEGNIPELSWEQYCEKGRIARREGDKSKWTLGDMGNELSSSYGTHDVLEFAREIGVGTSTLYSHMRVCRFYEKSDRSEYLERWDEDVITWSHFKTAVDMGSLELALNVLEDAALPLAYFHNGKARTSGSPFSVDELAYEVSLRLGKEEPLTPIDEDKPLKVFLAKKSPVKTARYDHPSKVWVITVPGEFAEVALLDDLMVSLWMESVE